ncbi:MAG: LPS translocon maturation chaperone LptM [Syntrophales bacterium]
MRRKLFFRWALAMLLIGIIFVAGCGKKGDPIPPKAALFPTAINKDS